MWQVSRILNVSPFSDDVARLTEPQLNFVLEMYAADNPNDFKFVRPGVVTPPTLQERQAQWENVLLGKEHDEFLQPFMPSKAVLEQAQRMMNAAGMLMKGANT